MIPFVLLLNLPGYKSLKFFITSSFKILVCKFNNKTNGITHRRWLLYSNPQLTQLLEKTIGPAFKKHPEKLEDLMKYVDNKMCIRDRPMVYDGKVDYIIHAASPASPLIMREDPVGTIAANTLGAFYTLSLAKEKNAKGYMFISSREIYGQPDENQEFFYENTYGLVDPLDARSCYPEGKKAAEKMCIRDRSWIV